MTFCNLTPAGRAADAAWLSRLVAESGVPIQQVEGFQGVKPIERKRWHDPTTVLKRRRDPKRELAAFARRALEHMA